ncbi:molybdate ABC transporter permease subunit [Caminibacter pacificus]|uniref:Molybdenum transport system permease n=1 Tax=Caminibacter pacificus TaxID=1424653 RepID=A0AAJ4UXC7_9BACT|nr:molybdate ABC transporter permease subunit [Caminibacter pacificus]QCI28983.1 molybdate ABC transporter permease subunit [Caminibacter pacificus]ROR39208.1 molybdate transport system permease protein [Caminibacter pacificus]
MDTLLNKVSQLDFTPLLLSFKLAFITTLILFFIVLPLAWFLSQTKSKIKPFLEAFFALPIVLPPTVLGFYILWAFSQNSPLGEFFQKYFDISLVFSFPGIVVASCIYSLPFMLQPIQSGIESLNKSIIEASYTLGKNKIETLFRVVLPNIKPSIITALIITFAHTIGEFGVVLMVGGSIPGVTKVASIAIYEYVENLDYFSAHIYSLILLILSFIVLFFVYVYNYSKKYKEI